MGVDPAVAASVVDAVSGLDHPVLVAQAGTAVIGPALRPASGWWPRGSRIAATSPTAASPRRGRPGALVDHPPAVARRALDGQPGRHQAVDGAWVRVEIETLCIHGDAPGAGETARAGQVGPPVGVGRSPSLRGRGARGPAGGRRP